MGPINQAHRDTAPYNKDSLYLMNGTCNIHQAIGPNSYDLLYWVLL